MVELKKQVMVVDSSKDHGTSLALSRAIMLPKDVANLIEVDSKEIRDLLVMQQVQSLQRASAISERMKEQSAEIKKSKKKISSLEKQTRLDSQVVKKARLKLATTVQKRDARNIAISEGRVEVVAIQLEKIMTSSWPIFALVFSTPKHSASKAAPPVIEPVDPPQAYSPLVLVDFNEEEMLEEADEIPEKSPEVVGELG
ncbi:hypothetical protein Acr_22g0005080 [Actinidia rufa]|uniref:Uncharacterized protein n=1 Tax=Actinidia rufa TaxID=165716 RepID=A0A7J0GJY1_9ERIC|nr:hypothetical protein Acr_22g0005080 [Actinidia rufa]